MEVAIILSVELDGSTRGLPLIHPASPLQSSPVCKKLPVRSRSADLWKTWDQRLVATSTQSGSQSGWENKRFMSKARPMLPGKGGATSFHLCWGRWIPGCTSYTAAQWGCCLGIDLVDPAEPPPRASPRSSAPDATWRRGRGGEGGERNIIRRILWTGIWFH